MGATAKIRLRDKPRANGTTQLRLQVVLDREILPIALGIDWPAVLVDTEAGRCLTKLPKIEQVTGYIEAVVAVAESAGGYSRHNTDEQ